MMSSLTPSNDEIGAMTRKTSYRAMQGRVVAPVLRRRLDFTGMQDDVTMQDAARVWTCAVAVSRPRGRADGAPQRGASVDRRQGVRSAKGTARANVALLLLLLMPLGLLHRALPGLCRYGRPAAGATSLAASRVAHDVPAPAVAERASAMFAGQNHHHHGNDLPSHDAVPSACGPAAIVDRPATADLPRAQIAAPVWRVLWPTTLAAAPPAPPPRLS